MGVPNPYCLHKVSSISTKHKSTEIMKWNVFIFQSQERIRLFCRNALVVKPDWSCVSLIPGFPKCYREKKGSWTGHRYWVAKWDLPQCTFSYSVSWCLDDLTKCCSIFGEKFFSLLGRKPIETIGSLGGLKPLHYTLVCYQLQSPFVTQEVLRQKRILPFQGRLYNLHLSIILGNWPEATWSPLTC